MVYVGHKKGCRFLLEVVLKISVLKVARFNRVQGSGVLVLCVPT